MEKIYFLGLLSNVNSSLLHFKLKHGFEVIAIDANEAVQLLSRLGRGVPFLAIAEKVFGDLRCINYEDNKVYGISNSFEVDRLRDENNNYNIFHEKIYGFDRLINQDLKTLFRKMRLYQEGDIRMPVKYYYHIENELPIQIMKFGENRPISNELYHIKKTELPDLYAFLKDLKLPFNEPYLQLAFENFELSYEINNVVLSFLTLMFSLESLFNPGGSEISYKISRNAAVLLGGDKAEGTKIFKDIYDLYSKRSATLHSGESKVNQEDKLKLRDYIRRSIVHILKTKKGKKDLLTALNSLGFGNGINIM